MEHLILKNPSSLGPKLFLIILLQNIFHIRAFCPYFYAVNVTTVFSLPSVASFTGNQLMFDVYSLLYMLNAEKYFVSCPLQTCVALVYTYITKMYQLTYNIKSFVNKTHVYGCKAGENNRNYREQNYITLTETSRGGF
jgi:hypothetical protein